MPKLHQRDLADGAVRGALDVPRDAERVEVRGGGVLAYDRDPLVEEARTLAGRLLGSMEERWAHTCGVAARATVLSPAVPAEHRPLLVAAAWLHDIGYATPIRCSGFHPLDGARHLCQRGSGELLAGLVAHHSGARFTASDLGLARELGAFSDPRCRTGRLADALTTADQTCGPQGRPMDVEARLADMLHRHGPDSPQARVHHVRAPAVQAAVTATEHRLLAARLAAEFS